MNKQFFTEQEAKALKGKSVMAKTDLLSAEIGTFGAVTIVDKYGIAWDDAGKTLLVWQVGIKWDTDDEDEEPTYDFFTRKDAFNENVEIVSKEKRKRGYIFTEEEAKALIGARVQAKTSSNSGRLKKGEVGTVTGVAKYTSSNGNSEREVEVTWDVPNERYIRQFSRRWFADRLEVMEEQLQKSNSR